MFVLSRLLSVAAVTACLFTLAPSARAQDGDRAYSQEDIDEIHSFILGNVVFILFHEFGHALISDLSLPVLGREEDAVDALATVLLLPDEPSDETDQMVLDAMDGWFLTDDYMAAEGEDLVMWDEHGLDLQRAYQVACLIYGSDPDGFADLADNVDLPDDRRESCVSEWEQVHSAWFRVLEPHIATKGKSGAAVTVVHEAPTKDLEDMAAFFRDTQVLETMSQEVFSQFVLPRPITVAAASCGEPNAFWDPDAARLTMCYELAAFYRFLIVDDIDRRSP